MLLSKTHSTRRKLATLAVLALGLLNSFNSFAAKFESTQAGNFGNGSTWVGGNAPQSWGTASNDTIIIKHAVTLNVDFTFGNKVKGLIINSGASLIGAKNITVPNGAGVVITNNGTLDIRDIYMYNNAPGSKFTNNGSTTLRDLIVQNPNSVTNNGTLITRDATFEGANFTNNGTVATREFKAHSPAIIINDGQFTTEDSNGDLLLYGADFTNNGMLNVGRDIKAYTPADLINTDTIIVDRDIILEGANLTNSRIIEVARDYYQKGNGTTDNSGFIDIVRDFVNNDAGSTITGNKGGFAIGRNSTNNGTITGIIDVCDASKSASTKIVDTNNGTISTTTVTICSFTPIPLPVDLISFTAAKVNNFEAKLDWTTAWEVNNSGFEVERSTNGKNWTKIGFVNGHGDANHVINYTFNTSLAGIKSAVVYYRLKQVDFNGQFEYSPVRSIRLGAAVASAQSVYPNPAVNKVTVDLGEVTPGDMARVTIMDMTGKIVMTVNQSANEGDASLEMNIENLERGNYIVNVTSSTANYNTKLIKL